MSRNRPSCDDGRRLGHNGRATRGGQCRSRLARQYASDGSDLGRADLGVGTDLWRAFQSGRVAGDELAQRPSVARIFPLRGRTKYRRLHWNSCRARNVRVALARACGQSAHGPRAMVRGICRYLWLDRHHSRRVLFQERGDSRCGRSLHNGGLLVHRVNLLRQSCRHDRPRADEQLFGDRASRRADVHCRAVRRRVSGARRHELVFQRVRCFRASGGVGAELVRWAMWSASALLLATVSFAGGRFSSFRLLPEIVATLPGDESEFSREFDERLRERFPVGSSEDKLLTFLTNEGFFPDWRSRDNPNASFFVQSGLICQKIIRVFWRANAAGTLTDIRGSYESQCI